MTPATTAAGRVTHESVADALRIGRDHFDQRGWTDGIVNPWAPSDREAFARSFALIAAPLGGMRETARIIGELSAADRIPGRMRTTAAFREGRA